MNIQRISKRYLILSVLWLIAIQAVMSIDLMRNGGGEMDDEAIITALDKLIGNAEMLLILAGIAALVAGITIFILLIIKGKHLNEAQCRSVVFFIAGGISCLVIAFFSGSWLLPDNFVESSARVQRIMGAGITDLAFAGIFLWKLRYGSRI